MVNFLQLQLLHLSTYNLNLHGLQVVIHKTDNTQERDDDASHSLTFCHSNAIFLCL